MNKLSAVIITKNEEINIGRCLKSILEVADEILVIDSGSTDRTESICKKFENVNFVSTDWKGFSGTKNFGNQLAKNDYILSLDADEELTDELKNEILKLKQAGFESNVIYGLNRITNYCGQWIYHSGWLPDYQYRIFPKKSVRWNSAQVHEALEFETPHKFIKLKPYLNHYSYYTIDEHIERMKSYTSLGADKVLNQRTHFLLTRAFVNSILRFFTTYFLKRGFLDGGYGLMISMSSAFTVFLKYFKAWQKINSKTSKTQNSVDK